MRCHAGAGHGPATSRGVFGVLCEECWMRVQVVVRKIRGER